MCRLRRPRRRQVHHQRLAVRRLVVPRQVAAHRVLAVRRPVVPRPVAAHRGLAVLRRRELAALAGDAVARLCSVRTRPRARHRRSSFRKGPANFERRSDSPFMTAICYVGNTASLVRYKYSNGDLKAQGEPEKLMNLPAGGHSTRNVIFNRAGTKMYIAVGSQSNNDAGEDCRRAAILEFNPDGSGFRVYATGIRNPVGLALQPGTDIIWTAMNERDNLGDDLVPDYATSVKDGGFYGWPYSYIGKNYDPRYVGAFPDLVNKALVPDVLIPAHSAALGITFYTGNQFPQRYRNGGFVALHGSWNRSVAAGYKVVFFPMTNGKPGPLEDFLGGFLSSTGANGTPIEKFGSPVGVTVGRDGSLLVSDDAANRIWKISAARK